MRALRVGTDFSGIEAPIQALRKLGVRHDHVFASEICPHALKVLWAEARKKGSQAAVALGAADTRVLGVVQRPDEPPHGIVVGLSDTPYASEVTAQLASDARFHRVPQICQRGSRQSFGASVAAQVAGVAVSRL